MKIQLVSDLHLEFGPITIPNNGGDVLILSGDICVANVFHEEVEFEALLRRRDKFLTFFDQVCNDFKHVIYVLGNHEHYHGDVAHSGSLLREALWGKSNLSILEHSCVDIDGFLFVGGTLWTDFDDSPIHKNTAQWSMNDYRLITIDGKRFTPDDSVVMHQQMLQCIRDAYTSSELPVIVCGHHAPSSRSISGRYVGHELNAAYSSDLDEFILDHPRIKLWTHGHIHSSSDYMIGETRVVANPRGYDSYEENTAFDPGMVIDL